MLFKEAILSLKIVRLATKSCLVPLATVKLLEVLEYQRHWNEMLVIVKLLGPWKVKLTFPVPEKLLPETVPEELLPTNGFMEASTISLLRVSEFKGVPPPLRFTAMTKI